MEETKKKRGRPPKKKTSFEPTLKQTMIDFINQKIVTLRQEIPELTDVRIEENPDRMIFSVKDKIELKEYTHDGITLPIEMEVLDKYTISKNKEAVMADGIFHKEVPNDMAKYYSIKEAIGPQNVINSKELKKRHPNLKFEEEE